MSAASSQLTTVFCASEHPELEQLVTLSLEQWPQAHLLKQNKGTTVTLLKASAGAVVVKHHRLTTWRRWADAMLRGSPARRAWMGAQLLQAQGFPIPRPLGVFEKRINNVLSESWYCSEGLLTQLPLDLYWRRQHSHWTVRQRRNFLRALAKFLRDFHASGLYAGDMRDANLLVEEVPPDQWKFYLVDFDRIIHVDILSRQRRLKNLVQLERTIGRSLHVSDRLFFLYCYFGDPLPPLSERRRFIRQLVRLRDRKDREYARRRRRRHRHLARELYASATPFSVESRVPPATTPREPISCCIICFNEEPNIRRCLESVKWCDEIVVIDSFSTDRTVEICREYTSRIIQRPWPGYVEQKRFALAQTTHEWVLNVDADEEVSPGLRQEILFVLQRNDPAVDGFYIPRLVYYLGRWWRRGWYPGYRLRLFRKAKVRWGGVDPHEKVLLRGHADRLHGDLYHYTYENIRDHLRAVNGLTDVAVREHALRGKHTKARELLLRPFWRFLRFYLLRGTVTYGVPGFFVAVTSAFYVFLKYAKLWEHTTQRPSSSQDSPHRSRESVGRRRGASLGIDDLSAQLGTPLHRRC
jgi:glycosyltransferase involved in cell wall biosynthesis